MAIAEDEAVVDALVAMGGQLVVLGAGDEPLEQAFLRAAERQASMPSLFDALEAEAA